MGRYIWLIVVIGLGAIVPVWGQNLKFDSAGHFKIVQFTDDHYVPNNPKSKAAIHLIEKVLDLENSDLVVLTGDIVTGRPARIGWDSVLDPILRRNIPFIVTLGNHDDGSRICPVDR